MDVYSTEEQQLEAIKNWWKKHGNRISWGLLIVAALYAGVHYWQHHRQVRLENASLQYDAMVLGLRSEDASTVAQGGQRLIEEYPGTPYASLAALTLAKQSVEANALDAAAMHLNWVIEHARLPAIQLVARLRLARVLVAQGDYEGALQWLNLEDTNGYTTLFQELQGDIYLAQGQEAQARQAFIAAWESLPESVDNHRVILRMKLEALGESDLTMPGEKGAAA